MPQYSDSFTNTDGTLLSSHDAKWTKRPTAATDFQIISNSVSTKTGTAKGSYWNDTTADNQCSEATLTTIPAGVDIWIGVAVRMQSATSANWYGFWTRNNNGSYLHKLVAGAITHIGTDGAGYPAGSVLRLEVEGNVLKPMVNGSVAVPPNTQTDDQFASGFSGICGYGSTTGDVLLDDWIGGDLAVTATERKAPDAIAASTNLSGSVANIQDDPDSPDGSWLTASSATATTDVRVTFPTPTGHPYGAQNFRALLRKTTGTPHPTADIMLYQGGASVATLIGAPAPSTTGTVVQADWNSNQLSGTVNGSDVECRIVSTAGLPAGALPAYSAVGTVETLATMPGTFDVAVPTHSAGDLLILHVLTRNNNNNGLLASINTAGWTQGGGAGTAYGGAQNARVGFGWKIGDGSESVVNVTTTGGTGTDRRTSRVYRFTAANGFASPPVANIATETTGTGTSISMPDVAASNTNQLAVALLANSVSSTFAAATGETSGNWTEPVAESAQTNGSIAIQVADLSGGGSVSGGTAAVTSGNWVAVGFTLVPAPIGSAVNTVEIGAIEWNVTYDVSTAGGGGSVVPAIMTLYQRRRIVG